MKNPIEVYENVLEQELYYKDNLILKYTIKYPHFESKQYAVMMDKLNSLYRTTARMYEKNNVMNLYKMAIADYEYAVANQYPIRAYEVYVDFTVTYNQNCKLSLYFDQYEYTGGAHGSTIRHSDNWDIQRSRRMRLSEFFPNQRTYKNEVIGIINEQIEGTRTEEGIGYFDDYETLVKENFKVDNFYLTEEGIVIFFQQYEIAPYAYGIPTFLIPYTTIGMEPSCD